MNRDVPLLIKWYGGDVKDKGKPFPTDCIPSHFFAAETKVGDLLEHPMYRSDDAWVARCAVKVEKMKATLKYNPKPKDKFYKGEAIIYFADENRNMVLQIDWIDDKGKLWEEAATCNWLDPV